MEKDLQEEEVVIPFNWVDGKTVYWPQGTNPLNAMKCHQNPGKNWLKFPLIKLQKTNNNVKILNSQQLRKKEKIRMLIFSKKKKKHKQREYPDYFPSRLVRFQYQRSR
nr:uncharacterized protein LOC124814393 [Hydra vulgaris]